MASLKDAARLTSQLNELTGQLHQELMEGDVDFRKMLELADRIGERADALASTFLTVDRALMQRIEDVKQPREGKESEQQQTDGASRRSR